LASDKYYDVGVKAIDNLISSIFTYTATEIGTDNDGDIILWSLSNDGYLWIDWD
jgi:hypothetical protein